MGAEIAKMLEQFKAKEVLGRFIVEDILYFITNYIKLYKEYPKEVHYPFDRSTENIVEKLGIWE